MTQVYEAIAAVMGDLSKEGITKGRKNQAQGYSFRGVDDVLNALSPLLTAHRLVILPRCLSRVCEERETKQGGRMAYVTVDCEFDFVAADGSKHTVRTFGEAMDSGDKATNKAMSAAFKYACFMSFCIPTEAEDADEQTHEVKPQPKAPAKPAPKPEVDPEIKAAGVYISQALAMGSTAFQEFKDYCAGKGLKWVDAALSAKRAGAATKDSMYCFLDTGSLEPVKESA